MLTAKPRVEQHDDHCRLTLAGQSWRIVRVRGAAIGLVNATGKAVLDRAGVDTATPTLVRRSKRFTSTTAGALETAAITIRNLTKTKP